MKKIRTRIAPSPTGSPHIGTAYAALFNYCFAKQNNGDFILRIEDTDRTRFEEGSEKEIIESLEWLGLRPDESPLKGGKLGPYRQSERLEIYLEHVQKLIENKKAYYCTCSTERLEKLREEQQARKELPHYDRKCRFDPPKSSENAVVRLAVPDEGTTSVTDKIRGEIEFQNQGIDDQVLLKSDGFPTYHLASVVDDHLMEISHVIRAEEWLSSTPKHVLLYKAFGWEVPEFVHLALLRNPDRSKISKRKNPVSLTFYREQGFLPEALVNFLGLMGWSMINDQEIFSLSEMVKAFTFERLDVAGPVFDIEKLRWMNGEYIRKLSDHELVERLKNGKFTKYSENQINKVLPLVKERMKILSEFDGLVNFFFEDISIPKSEILPKGKKEVETKEILNLVEESLKETAWDEDKIESKISEIQEKSTFTRGELFMLLRFVVTGSMKTPPLFVTMEKIGKEKTLLRLREAIEKLSD
ncbi:MAG: glutamate--tRNA ligase [Candidatus Magasanikbacteria bacterium]|nr:glutamate--tRNA ligase [Candidatus Magasanikbacteria bacterium]